MFHHFHGDGHRRSPGSISGEELAAVIDFIGPERILEPGEWLERAERDRLGPQDLCLTFDDALLCQFEIALPVMQHYDLRAFWFVYSNIFEGQLSRFEVYRVFRSTCFPEVDEFYELFFARIAESSFSDQARRACEPKEIARRREMFPFYSAADVQFRILRDVVLGAADYDAIMLDLIRERGQNLERLAENLWMSTEHLRRLGSSGHLVGLHSYSHPMCLGEQPRAVQEAEYARNYEHLSSITGSPRAIAYPTGSYNSDTLSLLRSMGIQCGFRSSMASPRGGVLNPNPLELAREDHANIVRKMQYS